MKSLIMPYGENGITFTLFNELGSEEKLRRFLLNIDWQDNDIKKNLSKENINGIYLFPCFGKGSGPGEPDVIIITENYNIFLEVEVKNIKNLTSKSKKKLNSKTDFQNQLERFACMGIDIKNYPQHIIRGVYRWKTGIIKDCRTKGTFRNRKIFKDLLNSEQKIPLLVVITNDNRANGLNFIKNTIIQFNGEKVILGFIGYDRIKKMKGLSKTGEVINFNLKE